MIPVPGLEQVKVKWILLEQEGFLLYGFLLYSNQDVPLVEYMERGLGELDRLSGSECAIFVIEPPSKEWVQYTRRKKHSWWRLFGEELVADRLDEDDDSEELTTSRKVSVLERNIIENNHHSVIIVGDGNTMLLKSLMDPDSDIFFDRDDALDVARFFGIDYQEIPCLIFFEELESRVIWKSILSHLSTQKEVKEFFREFFNSDEFRALLYRHGVSAHP